MYQLHDYSSEGALNTRKNGNGISFLYHLYDNDSIYQFTNGDKFASWSMLVGKI